MKLATTLPLASVFFKHWHVDDTEVGVVVAKGRFQMHGNGQAYAGPAPELAMADVFAGDPAVTALMQEQDIAPGKTGTDITLAGVAHAPKGEALRDWPIELAVLEAAGTAILTTGCHLRGPVLWRKEGLGWKQTAAQPVTEVPLDYALAYGGTVRDADGKPVAAFEENPAGKGFATPEALDGQDEWPAAQIGELGEFMAGGDPTRPMSVRGFGPVAKAWLPRRALAGTFDETWERTRHPRMPMDYDLGFWNAAPTALQIRPFLRGDEVIDLRGVTPDPLRLPLPAVGLGLQMLGDARAEQAMVLDTVRVDLTGPPALDLTWRALVPNADAYAHAQIGAFQVTPTPVGA